MVEIVEIRTETESDTVRFLILLFAQTQQAVLEIFEHKIQLEVEAQQDQKGGHQSQQMPDHLGSALKAFEFLGQNLKCSASGRPEID